MLLIDVDAMSRENSRKRLRADEEEADGTTGTELSKQFREALLDEDWKATSFHERMVKIYVNGRFNGEWVSKIAYWTSAGVTVNWIDHIPVQRTCMICGCTQPTAHAVKFTTNEITVACASCADRLTTILGCFDEITKESMNIRKRTNDFLVEMLSSLEGSAGATRNFFG